MSSKNQRRVRKKHRKEKLRKALKILKGAKYLNIKLTDRDKQFIKLREKFREHIINKYHIPIIVAKL